MIDEGIRYRMDLFKSRMKLEPAADRHLGFGSWVCCILRENLETQEQTEYDMDEFIPKRSPNLGIP